eukprot:7177193-Karenia_brevis.AAC.1
MEDTGVSYQDGQVCVDGRVVEIRIYNKDIAATPSFKYLGVVMDASGSAAAHTKSRLEALKRAISLLQIGLVRIPSCSVDFV